MLTDADVCRKLTLTSNQVTSLVGLEKCENLEHLFIQVAHTTATTKKSKEKGKRNTLFIPCRSRAHTSFETHAHPFTLAFSLSLSLSASLAPASIALTKQKQISGE